MQVVLGRSAFPEGAGRTWSQGMMKSETKAQRKDQRQRRPWNGGMSEKIYCKGLAQEREGENREGKIGHRPKRAGERSRLGHVSYSDR